MGDRDWGRKALGQHSGAIGATQLRRIDGLRSIFMPALLQYQ